MLPKLILHKGSIDVLHYQPGRKEYFQPLGAEKTSLEEKSTSSRWVLKKRLPILPTRSSLMVALPVEPVQAQKQISLYLARDQNLRSWPEYPNSLSQGRPDEPHVCARTASDSQQEGATRRFFDGGSPETGLGETASNLSGKTSGISPTPHGVFGDFEIRRGLWP